MEAGRRPKKILFESEMYPKITVNLCKWTISPAFVLPFIQKSSELITISPEMNEHTKL
jgi:hypothetical protein